jgi:hypothetical protein
MKFFFWMLLNPGVPIVGPIFTLALVVPAHGWRVAKALIAASVKDGQLFWCAIGLCASAAYEVLATFERGSREMTTLAFCMVGLGLVRFVLSIFVMSGSVNVHHGRLEAGSRRRTSPSIVQTFSRAELGISIFFTLIAVILFGFLHVHLIWFF